MPINNPVGNDFSAVAANALSQRQLEQQALQHGVNTLQETFRQRAAIAESNRQFAMQAANTVNALKQRQFENAMEQQKIADMGRRMDIQQEIGKGYLDLGRRQLDMTQTNGTPAQQRAIQVNLQRAQSDVAQGRYKSGAYGTITPEEDAAFKQQNDDVLKQKDAYAAGSSNYADTLNKYRDLQARQLQLKSKIDNKGWLPGDALTPEERKEYSQNEVDIANLKGAATDPMLQKQFGNTVTYDSKGLRYQSMMIPSGGAQTPQAPGAATPDATGGQDQGSTFSPAGGFSLANNPDSGTAPLSGFEDNLMNRGSVVAAAPGGTQALPMPYYDRMNELLSQGVDKDNAKRQALGEAWSGASWTH